MIAGFSYFAVDMVANYKYNVVSYKEVRKCPQRVEPSISENVGRRRNNSFLWLTGKKLKLWTRNWRNEEKAELSGSGENSMKNSITTNKEAAALPSTENTTASKPRRIALKVNLSYHDGSPPRNQNLRRN